MRSVRILLSSMLVAAAFSQSLPELTQPEKHSSIGKSSSGTCGAKKKQQASRCQLQSWSKAHSGQVSATATNQEGIPMPSLTATQAIGTRGQALLQDGFLLEKLAAFNRERIPERVVHAKGAGAFGKFKVLTDLTKYTKAKFLNAVGKRTEVLVRFSTVSGESGSADTLVDPKGFAVKFYTEEGNYDLVGDSLETFPINDPMLFPDLNRSRKRNPSTHLMDPTSWWDFITLRPETTMHTVNLFSDLGTPYGYRRMNGSGVHAFKWVNSRNESVYVKYHWFTRMNKKFMTPEEAIRLAGTDPDYGIQDLYDAIARGEYPSWNLHLQILSLADAAAWSQNPFDITKRWEVEDVPLTGPVGRLTLTKNPTDYFTEVESAAFSPANMVPGIEPSPDRVLHARMFAYHDAQRYRMGTNFAQLPVNKAKSRVDNYFRDGSMCYTTNGGGSPNYFPNSYGGLADAEAAQVTFPVRGEVDRIDLESSIDFSIPRNFIEQDLDAPQRQRVADNIAAFLVKADLAVQQRFLENNCQPISTAFRDQVATALDNARTKLKNAK